LFSSIHDTIARLRSLGYLVDEDLATAVYLSLRMGRPLFLEGEPGVGKTELAKALAAAFDTDLIRLQCHEGLDLAQALYEWDYPRQLLEIQARGERTTGGASRQVYREEFLLRRPLLDAIDPNRERAPVLLIDELDRADEEFESFLLELLSDFQVTIPEIGTLRARHRPIVVLTSNRTREIHDALKRRCLYHWIDYPSFEREIEIVEAKVENVAAGLRRQLVRFVQELRRKDLYKRPGVAETLDWAEALSHLGKSELDAATVSSTLGVLLKYLDDVEAARGAMTEQILAEVAGK
jgi:MoxR-like ATPase